MKDTGTDKDVGKRMRPVSDEAKPSPPAKDVVNVEEFIGSLVRKIVAEGRVKIVKTSPLRLKKNKLDINKLSNFTVRKDSKEMDIEPSKYTPKGRSLRKEFERPRPDLPADAVPNRNRKPVAVTLPPDLIEQLDARCRELDVTRTSFVEVAIRRALDPS